MKYITLIVTLFAIVACEKVSDTPPINQSKASNFVVPEAKLLNVSEKALVDAIIDEYDELINN